MRPNDKTSILNHLAILEKERMFFRNVSQINRYNIDSIIELIQFENVKETGDPIYTRREIRQGLKEYFTHQEKTTETGFSCE